MVTFEELKKAVNSTTLTQEEAPILAAIEKDIDEGLTRGIRHGDKIALSPDIIDTPLRKFGTVRMNTLRKVLFDSYEAHGWAIEVGDYDHYVFTQKK